MVTFLFLSFQFADLKADLFAADNEPTLFDMLIEALEEESPFTEQGEEEQANVDMVVILHMLKTRNDF